MQSDTERKILHKCIYSDEFIELTFNHDNEVTNNTIS